MNSRLGWSVISVVALGVTSLVGLAGCRVTVQTETKFNGTAIDKSAPWAAGKNVTIYSDNGEVTVTADGPADQVRVVAKPFAFAPDDEKQDAIDTMNNKLHLVIPEGGAAVEIRGQKDGSGSYGYDLEVHLPAAFDATFDVEQKNGGVTISSDGNAAVTKVVSNNGSIDGSNLKKSINLSTANGSVSITALPVGLGNVVHSDNGSVEVALLAGANLTINATTGNGSVGIPAEWSPTGSEAAKSVVLGDGTGSLTVSTDNGNVTVR